MTIHPMKVESFDITRKINIDPKGFKRRVDSFKETEAGLYMARGANHPRFGYLESWLLPQENLRVNIFHHRVERTPEFYIDVALITQNDQLWTTKDLYIDLICPFGHELIIDDIDELSACTAAGLISAEETQVAIETTLAAARGLSRHGDDPMAWLASKGYDLEWAKPKSITLTPSSDQARNR